LGEGVDLDWNNYSVAGRQAWCFPWRGSETGYDQNWISV